MARTLEGHESEFLRGLFGPYEDPEAERERYEAQVRGAKERVAEARAKMLADGLENEPITLGLLSELADRFVDEVAAAVRKSRRWE